MARQSAIRWLLTGVALLLAASAVFYADLLRAAFVRNPIPRSAESIARGRQLFEKDCIVCHGAEGKGDGVAAAGFPRRPKDLSRLSPPPIFPDGVVAYRIVHGVNLMPAFGGSLSEGEIWDLMNFIRSLRK
ncbi:MAG TPA: cytochrome c [Burkholderiales bacterium]|nr:cytochrome c [Burkholderiales bacterium]